MKKLILTLVSLGFVSAYSRVATNNNGQARSQGVAFTVSPIYTPTSKGVDELRPGEAIDHPSTAKYSTLDEEMVAKLDSLKGRSRAQDRFHPPSKFEHVLSHSNALKQSGGPPLAGAASSNDVIYTKPVVSMTYDYPPTNFDSNPMSTPPDSFSIYSPTKLSDNTYSSGPSGDPPPSLTEYDSKPPSFDFDQPPKSLDFPGHFDDLPSYVQPQETIYDQIPDDHFHHHHHHRPTTEEPEMMDQRLNKRPYSYYYIGRKLWYIPLYFSIYFIIYIGALVLKSIARHKINFPAHLAAVAEHGRSDDSHSWRDYLEMVLEGIEKYGRMP
ncbi:hypothetical protein TSAR_002978 [Trichomalopsis sarcophagae]|uniref:Uncharacterized protein n=1 Tax=Trichomalopsis sarcophagae TaxID=543379 RepID=A0A232EJ94_9HYME|nr:hypothetical protein TSAR_002978 [Trichomalopsis sarcophagae]